MAQYPTAPKGSSFGNLFDSLQRLGVAYEGSTSKGGLFHCPLHEDANASLQID